MQIKDWGRQTTLHWSKLLPPNIFEIKDSINSMKAFIIPVPDCHPFPPPLLSSSAPHSPPQTPPVPRGGTCGSPREAFAGQIQRIRKRTHRM